MKAWEAAVQILRETKNPAVMWGDAGLLHDIAERMGWPHDAWKTEKRVLDALTANPGILIRKKTMCHTGPGNRERAVRIFRLPNNENMPPRS